MQITYKLYEFYHGISTYAEGLWTQFLEIPFIMISRVGIEGLNSKAKVFHTQYFAIIKLVNASKKSSYYDKITTGNCSRWKPIIRFT